MNNMIKSCALVATLCVIDAIRIESEAEAPFVEINVATPDDYNEDVEEPFVEINVGDVDAVDLQEQDLESGGDSPALTEEEFAVIDNLLNPDYQFTDETDSAFIHWMYINGIEYTSISDYLAHLAEFVKDLEEQAKNEADEAATSLVVTNKFSAYSDEDLDILLSSGLDTEASLL